MRQNWQSMSHEAKRDAIEAGVADGKSTRQIGIPLGCRKGAVIGFAYRQGIKLRGKGTGGERKPVTLAMALYLDRRPDQCAAFDPSSECLPIEARRVCGAPVVAGQPYSYCRAHLARVLRPAGGDRGFEQIGVPLNRALAKLAHGRALEGEH